MYCRKCGKEIPDDSTFCPKCGTSTNSELTVSSSSPEGITSKSVPPIHPENIALQSTLVTPDVIARVERVLNPLKKIADLSEKKARDQKYINQKVSVVTIIITYILCIPISLICGWFMLLVTGSLLAEDKKMFYFIAVIVGLGLLSLYYYSQKKSKKKAEQRVVGYLTEIDQICCDEIDRDDLVTLPPSYRYYSAASFFYNCFINQRALTLQQAVNLYEEELHRNKMEQMQQANMRMLAQQNQALKTINRNAATAATMSSLTYMQMLFK